MTDRAPGPRRTALRLFPLSYIAHATDEALFGHGFPAWFSDAFSADLSRRDFLVVNGAGILVFAVAALVGEAHDRQRPGIVGVLSTIVVLNASLHLAASAITGQWVPGVLTGTLLWIPLGLHGLSDARRHLSRPALVRSLVVGIAVHGGVTAVALRL